MHQLNTDWSSHQLNDFMQVQVWIWVQLWTACLVSSNSTRDSASHINWQDYKAISGRHVLLGILLSYPPNLKFPFQTLCRCNLLDISFQATVETKLPKFRSCSCYVYGIGAMACSRGAPPCIHWCNHFDKLITLTRSQVHTYAAKCR